MAISKQDLENIVGAAHPEEDSSPSSISVDELRQFVSQANVASPPEKSQAPQPISLGDLKSFVGNSTRTQALGKGFLEGTLDTILSNTTDYIESVAPGAFSETQYPDWFLKATPQERRDYFKAQRAAVVTNFYQGVDTSNHEVLEIIGKLGGSVVDPLSIFTPANQGATVLARVGAMAKFGGAFGGAYGASAGLMDTGSIDPIETVTAAALGAVGGAAIQGALVEPLSALLRRVRARGTRVTPEEVENAVKSLPEGSVNGSVDPVKIADELNTKGGIDQMDFFGYTPEEYALKTKLENTPSSQVSEAPEVEKLRQVVHGTNQSSRDKILESGKFKIDESERKYDYSELGPDTIYFTDAGGWWLSPEAAKSGRNVSYETQVRAHLDPDTNLYKIESDADIDKLASRIGLKSGKELSDSLFVDGLKSGMDDSNLLESRGIVNKLKESGIDGLEISPDYRGRLATEGQLGLFSTEKARPIKYPEEQLDLFGASSKEITPEKARLSQLIENDLAEDPIDPRLIERDYKEGMAEKFLNGENISAQMKAAAEMKVKKVPKSKPVELGTLDDTISQEMAIYNDFWDLMKDSPELKKDIIAAAAKVKAPNPAMAGGDDAAAMAAIKSENISATSELGQKISPSDIQPISLDNPDPVQFQTIAQKVWAGSKKISGLGIWRNQIIRAGEKGERAIRLIDSFKEKVRQETSSRSVDMRRIFIENKLTPEEINMIGPYNAKIIDRASVPSNVAKAANQIRNMLDWEVNQAVEQGIISDIRGREILDKATKDGYWPRTYNIDYLKTPEGAKAFIDALNGVPYKSEKDIKILIRSIIGQKRVGNINNLIRTEKVNGPNGKIEKRYFVDSRIMKHIWDKTAAITDSGRSTHLEFDRKLPPEVEQAIQPFMLQDTEVVLDKYFQDTVSRNVSAKLFGKNHDVAKDIIAELNSVDPKIARSFKEMFLATLRDPSSELMQSFLNRSDFATNTARVLKALQVFKLFFSQLTNLTQVPVNGSTWLSNRPGITPIQKFQIGFDSMLKGFRAQLGNEALKEEAVRAGATNATALMEVMGRVNDATNSILGTKAWGPLEMLNNPSVFLKRIGFTWTEDLNRIWGFHMGKGYIESLLANKMKYEEILSRRPDGKVKKQLESVYKGLEEMGISRDTPVDSVSLKQIKDGAYKVQAYSEDLAKQIALGGQKATNAINFVNDIQNLPQFASSFWGKLMFQLKTFAYHQWQFTRKEVIKPALKGNFVPLATYLTAGTMMGMPLNEAKRFLMADNSKLHWTEKLLNAQISVAGFGIVQDFLKAAQFGKQGVYSAAFGPGISTAVDLTTAAVGDSYKVLLSNKDKTGSYFSGGNPLQPLGKAVLRQFMFPGKKWVMSKLTADKDAFEAQWNRFNKVNQEQSLDDKLDKLLNR